MRTEATQGATGLVSVTVRPVVAPVLRESTPFQEFPDVDFRHARSNTPVVSALASTRNKPPNLDSLDIRVLTLDKS